MSTLSTAANAQDFVIKRRRTRHAAIDPCLGFYSVQHTDPHITNQTRDIHPLTSTVNYVSESSSEFFSFALPSRPLDPTAALQRLSHDFDVRVKTQHTFEPRGSITPNHEDTNVSSPIQIHVEEFLQRTAPKHLVKYGHRGKRRAKSPIISGGSGGSDESLLPRPLKRRRREGAIDRSRSSSSPVRLSLSKCNKHKAKPKTKQPRNKNKKVQSLAERLIKASVLSHGNPAECLLNPDLLNPVLHSGPPINFVPDTQNSKSLSRRAWTLVDPKKAAPFRLASFRTRAKQEPSIATAPKCKPLSKWMGNSDVLEEQSSFKILNIKRRHGTQATKSAVDSLRCLPLALISLKDAESAYSQSKRNKKTGISRIDQRTSKLHRLYGQHPGIAVSTPLLFVSDQPSRPVALPPLQLGNFLETLPPPTQHNGSFLDNTSIHETFLGASEISNHLSSNSLEENQILSHSNVASRPQTLLRNASLPSDQPFVTPPNTTTKTLRPLGSFFDGFRERGRSATVKATENAASIKQKA